jgi:uncharacterized membrane protein
MEKDDEINELLIRIDKLSREITKYHNEINLLKSEVTRLKGKSQTPLNKEKNLYVSTAPGFENFIGLKLIHFVGIVTLIIGLSIGVKYAIDIHLISAAMRVALAYAAGIILFFISQRLKKKYELFSMILFSGSAATAYFTTYAAFEYYHLISAIPAFCLMLGFTFLTVYNSIKYKRQEIAILGLVGAYGIPFFVRGNSDNALALFSYIFLINIGILIISYKKYWIALTYISFFTTWIIFLSWTIMHFGDTHSYSEVLFSYLFFFLFIANCLLFKIINRKNISSSDVIIVILDTVLFYFALVVIYYKGEMITPKNITLVFAIAYLLAAIASKKTLTNSGILSNALYSISLIALIAFVAMQFNNLTVTIIWVIMAVSLFIIGMMNQNKFFRIMSILLFAAILVKLLLIDSMTFSSIEKVFAYIFTGTILLVISFLYQKFKKLIFKNTDL